MGRSGAAPLRPAAAFTLGREMWQNGDSTGRQFAQQSHKELELSRHSEPMYACIKRCMGLYVRRDRAIADKTWRNGTWQQAGAQNR